MNPGAAIRRCDTCRGLTKHPGNISLVTRWMKIRELETSGGRPIPLLPKIQIAKRRTLDGAKSLNFYSWRGPTSGRWARRTSGCKIRRSTAPVGIEWTWKAGAGPRLLCGAAQSGDIATVREILASGQDPNVAGPYGWTALHSACENGHIEVIRLLVENGADVTARLNTGKTPLDLLGDGHEDLRRELREAESGK